MVKSPKKDEKTVPTRRGFLKTAVLTAGSAAAFLGTLKFVTEDGIKAGKAALKFGMSEAQAACGMSSGCSGGGGECGMSSGCAGGGGKCGMSSNCAGT